MTSIREPLHGAEADEVRELLRAPSNLTISVNVARLLLAQHEQVDHRDLYAVNRAHGALAEALRLVLRAVDTEPAKGPQNVSTPAGDQAFSSESLPSRCPAAFTDDAAPCDGPPVVLILDPNNRGAEGCEHHGTRLLAVIKDGRAVALPDAPEGTASRVFRAAASSRFFTAHEGGGR